MVDRNLEGGLVWHEDTIVERPIYIHHDRITAKRDHASQTVDLSGFVIFPGLINSHDHLELNHFPRTRLRERYSNAHEWGEDCSTLLNREPFRGLRKVPMHEQLLIGALKNLLSGVTRVVHHNPLHRPLRTSKYPVKVLQNYAWGHSLHFESIDSLQTSFRKRRPNTPWIVHLAEGTDSVAQAEFDRLEEIGLVSSDTVLVHGVGLLPEQIKRAARVVRGLIVCPSTNLYLLSAVPPLETWLSGGGRAALGSDSRLTASGSLLDELATLLQLGIGAAEALRLVTVYAARIFDLPDEGHLAPGARGNLIVIRAAEDPVQALCTSKRSDIALVMHDGKVQIATPEIAERFKWCSWENALLDGEDRCIAIELAQQIRNSKLKETGLILKDGPRRKWFWSLHG